MQRHLLRRSEKCFELCCSRPCRVFLFETFRLPSLRRELRMECTTSLRGRTNGKEFLGPDALGKILFNLRKKLSPVALDKCARWISDLPISNFKDAVVPPRSRTNFCQAWNLTDLKENVNQENLISIFSRSIKEARKSFHFRHTRFTNSFPKTVWLIVSVWNLPQT